MSWYNTQGPLWDLVLFSKVRYIRNIAKHSFYPNADIKRGAESSARLDAILQKNGFRADKLAQGVSAKVLSLAEKQFVERDFLYSDKGRTLYLNEPCNLTVALGGDNFISISSIVSGANISEARNMAMGAEELIDREIPFAYLEGIGYLSPRVADCGSGVEFSSAVYLPSIRLCSNNASITAAIPTGMTLRPMISGKENAGDLYILSYIPHYLASEESAAKFFSESVLSIVENEKSRIGMIVKNQDKTIFDRARRALGLLLYSSTLTQNEMLRLLSDIRLYLCSCATENESLPKIQSLNYLTCEGLSASVLISSKEKCESASDCDRARATLVSSYIEHKNEVKNVK